MVVFQTTKTVFKEKRSMLTFNTKTETIPVEGMVV